MWSILSRGRLRLMSKMSTYTENLMFGFNENKSFHMVAISYSKFRISYGGDMRGLQQIIDPQ